MPGTSAATSSSISAFTTSRKSPSVSRVSGRVSSTNDRPHHRVHDAEQERREEQREGAVDRDAVEELLCATHRPNAPITRPDQEAASWGAHTPTRDRTPGRARILEGFERRGSASPSPPRRRPPPSFSPPSATLPARDLQPGVATRRQRVREPRARRERAPRTAPTSWWTVTEPSRPSREATSRSRSRARPRGEALLLVARREPRRSGRIQICRKCTGASREALYSLCVTPVPARHALHARRAGSPSRCPGCPCARARPRARR